MASRRHRAAKPGSGRATVTAAASAAVVASAAALAAVAAGAEPHDPAGRPSSRSPGDRIATLYAQAERATERYNAARTRAQGLRRQVDRLQDRVARGQGRVNRMRMALGALAGDQYRSGGIDPGLVLLLSEDPAQYLDKAATLERITSRQAAQLRVLQGAQRTLRQERAEAAAKLVKLEHSRRAVARHKRTVQRRLATARRLVHQLPPREWETYARRASRAGGREPGALAGGLPGSAPGSVHGRGSGSVHGSGSGSGSGWGGFPDGLTGGPDFAPSSGRAAAAVDAARAALGLPYAWGQAGPTAFDCSGLTQWAYARAGVAIPRTSQAQAHAGQPVPLSQARPGDLVVYRSDASHVALYAGNGQVIHAPYPGARVRYDPVGMLPISSITRV
ncbi:NlpC/P60 family protein [Streptomyces luomodiensis]|uniref:NlpC/P60 family protein n=1 Tax=Streptomyces luomodiensis TaxID=3026192 RepID=A0ABY9UU64_9ACTN|nr:NlpC/P60 family protein [Streptomyces sp. SCA4-21]WNE96081.1 NlpC/P60 family protein [Streptomyces sp. SCA4-21]